jgi:hypothetical protein
MARPDVLSQHWHAQPDDLIGGWCVTNSTAPPSTYRRDDTNAVVAAFIEEECAQHIAELHNAALDARGALQPPFTGEWWAVKLREGAPPALGADSA